MVLLFSFTLNVNIFTFCVNMFTFKKCKCKCKYKKCNKQVTWRTGKSGNFLDGVVNPGFKPNELQPNYIGRFSEFKKPI